MLDGSGSNGGPVHDRQNGGFRFGGNGHGRLEYFGEDFDAGDESRAGPRKVTAGFKSVHAAVSNSGNRIPLIGKID